MQLEPDMLAHGCQRENLYAAHIHFIRLAFKQALSCPFLFFFVNIVIAALKVEKNVKMSRLSPLLTEMCLIVILRPV
jgi:hypothetical protein